MPTTKTDGLDYYLRFDDGSLDWRGFFTRILVCKWQDGKEKLLWRVQLDYVRQCVMGVARRKTQFKQDVQEANRRTTEKFKNQLQRDGGADTTDTGGEVVDDDGDSAVDGGGDGHDSGLE